VLCLRLVHTDCNVHAMLTWRQRGLQGQESYEKIQAIQNKEETTWLKEQDF